MRLVNPRWVLPLALLSILPLVALGWLLTERLSELNRLRYEQEVLAARYAGELASNEVRRAAEDYFRSRSENLSWAHLESEEKFQKTLRSLYFTSPLLDVPQFVEEADLRAPVSSLELARVGADDGDHRCENVVVVSLRRALIERGRERLDWNPKTKTAGRTRLVAEESDAEVRRGLQWYEVDLDGPLAEQCAGCEEHLAKVGVLDSSGHVAILSLSIPMPGRGSIQSGMFGAVIPAKGLLKNIIAPTLYRWTETRGAIPRHGLRVVDGEGQVLLPWKKKDEPSVLHTASALYSESLLGVGSPWRLEVVALSGFDLGQIKHENRRWSWAMVLAALLLAGGAILLARGLLHHRDDALLRSHLMGNISHELKTPLSLIRLYSETLESGRAEKPEDRQRFLGVIGRESKRLGHLIDNLLDIQRIESDRKQYSFAQVRPGRIVQQTVESYRYQITESGFELKLDVDEELPLLYLDEEALAQALINLLDNAAKYSDTTKEIRVGCTSRHGEVRISVTDRGIGIPPREQKKIFESFYRVEKSNVHDVKGSGLGLAVVAHVVDHHGGRIEVDSTPGKGSTFTMVLPVDFDPHES